MAVCPKPAYVSAVFLLLITACGTSAASTPTPTASTSTKIIESNNSACANLAAGARYRAVCNDSVYVDGADDAVCAQHGGVGTWMICPQATASPTSSPGVTITPAPTYTPKLASSDIYTNAYMPVIRLLYATNMIELVSVRVKADKLSNAHQIRALNTISSVVSETQDMFNQPAPVNALQPAWDKGKSATSMLTEVLRQWTAHEIKASDVRAALAPANEQIAQVRQLVEQVLISQYDFDADTLRGKQYIEMAPMMEALDLFSED